MKGNKTGLRRRGLCALLAKGKLEGNVRKLEK
jgi:hypothetical protein